MFSLLIWSSTKSQTIEESWELRDCEYTLIYVFLLILLVWCLNWKSCFDMLDVFDNSLIPRREADLSRGCRWSSSRTTDPSTASWSWRAACSRPAAPRRSRASFRPPGSLDICHPECILRLVLGWMRPFILQHFFKIYKMCTILYRTEKELQDVEEDS